MKLSRERIVLLVLLGTGFVGLVVDRVLLGSGESGPNTASADALTVSVASGAPGPVLDMATPSGPTLAQRLADAAERLGASPGNTREAFAVADDWIEQGAAGQSQADSPAPAAEQFTQEHKLMAVMAEGDKVVAIIDGKPLALGQRLDGFQLVGLAERTAVFSNGRTRVELKLGTR